MALDSNIDHIWNNTKPCMKKELKPSFLARTCNAAVPSRVLPFLLNTRRSISDYKLYTPAKSAPECLNVPISFLFTSESIPGKSRSSVTKATVIALNFRLKVITTGTCETSTQPKPPTLDSSMTFQDFHSPRKGRWKQTISGCKSCQKRLKQLQLACYFPPKAG